MKKIYAILSVALLAFAPARLFNNTVQSLPFTQDWATTTLITVNDDWSGVAGIEGYLGQNITTGTGVDPQTLLTVSLVANDLSVLANQANTSSTSGDVGEFDGLANPTIGLQGSGTADAPYIVIYLNTTGQQNINVAYNLRDIDGSADNAIQPVALQYRVGNTGDFTNVPAGFVADATEGPSLSGLVTAVSAVLPAACNNAAEVQVRVITANAAGSDEWVGIDDINITGSPLSGNSTSSDIIANGSFSAPSNINYANYQATDITDVNSLEVAQFTIRDGGAAADGDAVGTILTNFVMSLSNPANIRRVALYDGTTELAELAGGATVNFSGLTVTAPDDGTKTFSVRVTFNTAVTDNHQFVFTVTSATADAAGSNFAAANAGGAASSSAGDDNRLEVTADRLAFVQNTTSPTGLNAAMTPAPTVSANDVNANRDLDFTAFIDITSTGTLLGTPVSTQAVAGLSTFSGAIIHTANGTNLELTAASTGLTSAVSNPFNIQSASTATDYFRSIATGDWGTLNTWESSADNSTWIPATLIPDANANTITIRNGNNVTVADAAGADQVVVETGATLTLSAAFTLADGTGTDLDVNGTVINNAGTHVITGAIVFNANSLYQHNRNGGTILTATWNASSTMEVTGNTSSTSITGANQAFGNFTWNSPGHSSTLNLVGQLATVNGNFRVQNSGSAALRLTGSADLNLTVAGDFIVEDNLDIDNNTTGVTNISIGGNVSHTAGTLGSSTDVATITLTGAGRTLSIADATYSGTNIDWVINTGASISLNSSLTIAASRSLALSGIVELGNNNLVVAGSITGGSATAYVRTNGTGTLTINNVDVAPVTFPIGHSKYNPIIIENGSTHNWTAKVTDGLTADPGYNTDKAVLLTWDITPSVNPPAGGADITFQFDEATQVGTSFSTGTTVQAWRKVSGNWIRSGVPAAVNTTVPNAAIVKVTGLTGFSQYALSNIDGPLPVKFTNVKAYQQGSGIKVEWSNLTETNVANYKVERSVAGQSFAALTTVLAAKNDGGRADYSFIDALPVNGVNLYRIRATEADGQKLYSVIVRVDTRGGITTITVYPNPVTAGQLSLQATELPKGLYNVQVYNAAGQKVHSQQLNHNGGSVTEMIQLPASLRSGMYNLHLSNGDMKLGKTFIVR